MNLERREGLRTTSTILIISILYFYGDVKLIFKEKEWKTGKMEGVGGICAFYCLNCDLWDSGIFRIRDWLFASECRSHLGECAAKPRQQGGCFVFSKVPTYFRALLYFPKLWTIFRHSTPHED